MRHEESLNSSTAVPSETCSPPSDHQAAPLFKAFADQVDYSLMRELHADPEATSDGKDHRPRQVRSGHYVPVTPTPIAEPVYIAHSTNFFTELGLDNELVHDADFCRMFSGDLTTLPEPLHRHGWATGYALSIYGTEYTQQCPFQTGNGYGDGRAISVCEYVHDDLRWEMQLKGGGPTPYCRGADGRAVLRSSVREFLAQEFMHALGVPTSRSLTLFASQSETVLRPWYSPGSKSFEPNVMTENLVAISTRVAPSFLRVGQIELFARRARKQEHPKALEELATIVAHAIKREYADEIDQELPFSDQVVALAGAFRTRLITLVGHWLRVGYCQGNFNSDNCALGGFILDYGPFGFCEHFDPHFQPWTGGGQHFSFFNQPIAAEANYHMLWTALSLLVPENSPADETLGVLRHGFAEAMRQHVEQIWTEKIGFTTFRQEIIEEMFDLMKDSEADFTIFFRELSQLPASLSALEKSFAEPLVPAIRQRWEHWFTTWHHTLTAMHGDNLAEVSLRMQQVNPKYSWREWLIVPAYQNAEQGDYSIIHELQTVFSHPYDEQGEDVDNVYYQIQPKEFSKLGGVSHFSCSS